MRIFRVCAALLFFLQPFFAVASSQLPEFFLKELKQANIPEEAVTVYVQPLSRHADPKLPAFHMNGNTPYVPASIMKIVTTYSALEVLGPAWRWKTAAYFRGSRDGDVLDGDLVFRGSGDPKFSLENFWLFLRQIRARGIREIRGDLVLDRSAFEAQAFDPAAFDEDPSRPYNAGPDALLLNHKVLELVFRPNGLDGTVTVLVSPELDGVRVTPPVLRDSGDCGAWQKELTLRFSENEVLVEGEYPLACAEQTWLVYPYSMSDPAFFRAVFVALWKELGGTFSGTVREGVTPPDANPLAEWLSPALSEVIRDVNKYSNNVMARHVLMAVGTRSSKEPASPERGAFAVRSFLASKGIPLAGLQIENGSGLSRTERISALTMSKVLVAAFHSPVMPELMASLPVAGRDGTLWKRFRDTGLAGNAHLKTGAIQDVRSIAGYVLAASGERYAVVFMVNHPNAAAALRARDALLTWLYDNG